MTLLAKTTQLNPNELSARNYVDRLILEKLTELREVIKPSEISDQLQKEGIGLAAVRSLLASNPEMFAYSDRRWVPAARVEGMSRPLNELVRLLVERFGGPMPMPLLITEVVNATGQTEDWAEAMIKRTAEIDRRMFITLIGDVFLASHVFVAEGEDSERAFAMNKVSAEEVNEAASKLKDFDWRQPDAINKALEQAAPVSLKGFGAAAWKSLNPEDPRAALLYDWREFNAELLSIPGFVYATDGRIYPESETKNWISTAVKLADKLAPTVEIEDAAPIDLKKEDVETAVKRIIGSEDTVTATSILESQFEITPTVKTFPDDMANLQNALGADKRVWWVGGDRYKKQGEAPDFVKSVPEPFEFVQTSFLQEDGDPVDVELVDEGLSSSLRKLIVHPLATDVNDEEILPEPKNLADTLRLVLKPIHRELGTFPMCQFPTGWFYSEPNIQELIFIDPQGRELQVWLSHEARLLFNLFDWWLDQPVESGAVFSLTRTTKPNVFEFAWLDQTDPVVYISNQRMEELREIASRADDMSTFDILREVMTHWPKGADFLTVLWEVNVVRRTSRRLLASLLSSYVCFYQRSGSPVWHYDQKKVDQGFDKTKKKFIKKD